MRDQETALKKRNTALCSPSQLKHPEPSKLIRTLDAHNETSMNRAEVWKGWRKEGYSHVLASTSFPDWQPYCHANATSEAPCWRTTKLHDNRLSVQRWCLAVSVSSYCHPGCHAHHDMSLPPFCQSRTFAGTKDLFERQIILRQMLQNSREVLRPSLCGSKNPCTIPTPKPPPGNTRKKSTCPLLWKRARNKLPRKRRQASAIKATMFQRYESSGVWR